jgi:uncharacterized membrane protein YfcA
MILLGVICLVAAIVNGALGYGFSSIAVPLALLVVGNRVLNPALVLLEVVMNAYVLWVNRDALPRVWRRATFVIGGLAPGIVVGTAALTHIDPAWLKLGTFGALLPLILLQAGGYRRPIRAERAAGFAFGGGVGALYAITTISGPPLAMFLNNQGYAKQDFRAALGAIRVAESALTAALYARAGLFTPTSMSLLAAIVPSVIVGVPIGAFLIRHVREESFRRVCMTFDAAIVSLGVSVLLRALHVVDSSAAYAPFVAVVLFDVFVLYRFFRTQSPSVPVCAQLQRF